MIKLLMISDFICSLITHSIAVGLKSIAPSPPYPIPDDHTLSAHDYDFEQLLEHHVGGWGPYQRRYLFFFAIVTLELAYVTYSPILYLYVPESYHCTTPPGECPYESVQGC